MLDSLKDAYDPERFRREGHALVDALADHLAQCQSPEAVAQPVMTWMDPDTSAEAWLDRLEDGDSEPQHVWQKVREQAIHVHHPHNMGHQVGVSLPLAALADLQASLLDTGNGVYEVGVPTAGMERAVMTVLSRALGYDPDCADGILTSGGSLGNLTALLTAWRVKAPDKPSSQLAIMVSSEAHYCIARAMRLMGFRDDGLVALPIDDQYRVRENGLQAAMNEAISNGLQVIAVVASACSTATGSFDPIESMAAFCQSHNLWLHVDGAHGGAAVFSEKHRPLLAGVEQADSVIIDFHKMLMIPTATTAVVYRQRAHAFQTFAQKADYLWRNDSTQEWYDYAKRTFECTRPMLSLKIYTILKAHGIQLFEDYVDITFALGQTFADLIEGRDDFELLLRPQANVLCYRYAPPDKVADIAWCNAMNARLRQELVEEGKFYIVQTDRDGVTYLRSALMNPFIKEAHLKALLIHIRSIADREV